MEAHKIAHFEREHGPGSFPAYITIGLHASARLQRRLAEALGMDPASTGVEILSAIHGNSQLVEGLSAEDECFDLHDLCARLGLESAKKLILNWHRFESMDEIGADDFFTHFSDIWYPSVDDLEAIHDDLAWIILISHYGAVSVWRNGRG